MGGTSFREEDVDREDRVISSKPDVAAEEGLSGAGPLAKEAAMVKERVSNFEDKKSSR